MKKNILIPLLYLSTCIFGQDNNYNVIQTAIPFLNYNENARISAIGEIGVVTSSFYKNAGLIQNPSLLVNDNSGFNYSHLTGGYGIELTNFGCYYSIDSLNSLGYNYVNFSLGNLSFVEYDGSLILKSNPTDYFHNIIYARKITHSLSIGTGFKYIVSDFKIPNINRMQTYAIDFGVNYKKNFLAYKFFDVKTGAGVSVNNIGPKVSYTGTSHDKDFIPTTLRIGLLINPEYKIGTRIRVNAALLYQMDKLLVPTPPIYEVVDGQYTGRIIKGTNPNVSAFRGMFQSFYDAPDGFGEEIDELIHKFGSELRINYEDKIYLALRLGKFKETKFKGNRNYTTKGLGIGAFGFSIDYAVHRFSYEEELISISYGFNFKKSFFRF